MNKFLIIYFSLVTIGLLILNSGVLQPVESQWSIILARICWFLIHYFDSNIILSNEVLRHQDTGFALAITHECTAFSVTWILCAFILAFPSGWKEKLFGFLIAFVILQAVNIFRLIILLYLGDWLPTASFDMIHNIWFPLFLNFIAFVFAILWLMHKAQNT